MTNSNNDTVKEIVLPAVMESIPQALTFVGDGLDELGCVSAARTMLVVASDEIVSNIVKFAYGPSTGSVGIRISALQNGKSFEVCFIDQGIAFSPLDDTPRFDASAAVKKRRIGGQGVKITKRIVDKIEYERSNGSNILRIRKCV